MPPNNQLTFDFPMAAPPSKGSSLFTVGHSNYDIEQFIELLQKYGIEGIIDVRSKPYSKYNPQFRIENLKPVLKEFGIKYAHEKKLGGMEDLAVTDDLFVQKMAKIRSTARKHRVAMMCAERNPMECHRAYKLSAWVLRNSHMPVHHIHPNGLLGGVGLDKRLVQAGLIDDGFGEGL